MAKAVAKRKSGSGGGRKRQGRKSVPVTAVPKRDNVQTRSEPDPSEEAARFLHELSRVDLRRLSYLMQDRKTQLLYFFVSGLARGIGSAIGFACLLVLAFVLLKHLAAENLPLIGDFLAELVKFVQRRL